MVAAHGDAADVASLVTEMGVGGSLTADERTRAVALALDKASASGLKQLMADYGPDVVAGYDPDRISALRHAAA
jgi:hypothetical protein